MLRTPAALPQLARRAPLLLLLPLLGLAAVGLACGSGGTDAPRRAESLVNIYLGPDYSQWLVGPIGRLATPEETAAYQELRDDFAAADFIEAFWSRRDPDPATPGNPTRELFEQRAAEADTRYRESGILGRRTARGTIYVLHGDPESIDYEIAPDEGPAIEVWRYPEGAEPGLSGNLPSPVYRYRKIGDVTVFYRPRPVPPRRPF